MGGFLVIAVTTFFISLGASRLFSFENSLIAPAWGVLMILSFVIVAVVVEKDEENAYDSTQKLKDKIKRHICSGDFISRHHYISQSGALFVAVDEKRSIVRFGGLEGGFIKSLDIKTSDVLDVAVLENGGNIGGKTDLGSIAGLAAAGGLLFGGAGAVVGAIAGQNSKVVNSVSLVISVDDLESPFVSFNFLESEVARGSNEHRAAVERANRWLGVFKVLMHRTSKPQ